MDIGTPPPGVPAPTGGTPPPPGMPPSIVGMPPPPGVSQLPGGIPAPSTPIPPVGMPPSPGGNPILPVKQLTVTEKPTEGNSKPTKTEKSSEELKPRSIRTTDSTNDELKSLMAKYNWSNHNQALQTLINAYELANAQSILVNRQTEIEDYNLHIQGIVSAYLRSLELAENTEERVKSRVEVFSKEKEKEICNLRDQSQYCQDEMKRYREENHILTEEMSKCSEQNDELKERLKYLSESETRKDAIIESITKLNPKCEEQENIITALKQEVKSLKEYIEKLEQTSRDLTNSLNKAEHDYLAKAKSDLQELEASRKEVQDLGRQVNELTTYYQRYITEHPEEAERLKQYRGQQNNSTFTGENW